VCTTCLSNITSWSRKRRARSLATVHPCVSTNGKRVNGIPADGNDVAYEVAHAWRTTPHAPHCCMLCFQPVCLDWRDGRSGSLTDLC